MLPEAREIRYITQEVMEPGQVEALVTALHTCVSRTTGLTADAVLTANRLRPNLAVMIREGEEASADVTRAIAKHWIHSTWDRDHFAKPGSGGKLSFDVNYKDVRYQNRERVLPALVGGYYEFQETGVLAGTWREFTNQQAGGSYWLTDGGTHNNTAFANGSVGAVKHMRGCPWYKWAADGWHHVTIPAMAPVGGRTDADAVVAGNWPANPAGTQGAKVGKSQTVAAVPAMTPLESAVRTIFMANSIVLEDPGDEEVGSSTEIASLAAALIA